MANLPFTGNLREFSGLLYAISTKIPLGHEHISKMLPENPKIKKIYRGNLLSVYIYTKKLFFTFYNIFSRNLKSSLHLIPIT